MYGYPVTLSDLRLVDRLAEVKHYRQLGRHGYGKIIYQGFLRPLLQESWLARLRTLRPLRVRAAWVKPQPDQPGLASACQLDERFSHPPGTSTGTQMAVVNLVRRPFDYARFSTIDVQAAYAGVEWRLPFLDRRVVDFLVHLPRWLQCWRGHDRIVLRAVMQGRMPEAPRVGPKRGTIIPLIHQGTRVKERQRIESIMKDAQIVSRGFVELSQFEQAYGSYCKNETEDFDLRLTVLMEAWLRNWVEEP